MSTEQQRNKNNKCLYYCESFLFVGDSKNITTQYSFINGRVLSEQLLVEPTITSMKRRTCKIKIPLENVSDLHTLCERAKMFFREDGRVEKHTNYTATLKNFKIKVIDDVEVMKILFGSKQKNKVLLTDLIIEYIPFVDLRQALDGLALKSSFTITEVLRTTFTNCHYEECICWLHLDVVNNTNYCACLELNLLPNQTEEKGITTIKKLLVDLNLDDRKILTFSPTIPYVKDEPKVVLQ